MATITDIVAASGDYDTNGADFDILLRAVEAAGLAAALADTTADLTVFAPSDAAFLSLATTLGYTGTDEAAAFAYLVDALTLLSGGGDPIPLLTDILKYHVAPGSLTAAELGAVSSVMTLLGVDIGISGTTLEDADPDLDDPQLVTTDTDIAADNGIIHVIDGVLIPADILQSDGNDDVDFIIGDDDREVIHTGKDRDYIDGNGGNDLIFSGKGDDVVLGGDGNDRIFSHKGNDTVDGGAGNDFVHAHHGDDVIKGGDGKDFIFAHHGDDTISGGAGDDFLRGHHGDDVFVFAEGDGTDYIKDFGKGADKIDVSAYGITSFDDLDISSRKGRAVIDFGEDMVIMKLKGHNELDASDFIFA